MKTPFDSPLRPSGHVSLAGNNKINGPTNMRESAVLLAARGYISRGFFVVPIPPGGNRPFLPEWQELRLSENQLPKYFRTAENIGLLLSPSGLVDVDCDCVEAVAVARILLPRTQMVHGHTSNPSSHLYFRATKLSQNFKFLDPRYLRESAVSRSTIIEIRVNGQTVVPPSINQRSGERVVWEQQGEPADVNGLLLLKRVERIASAALIARYWPNGARHNATLALAGMLVRADWLDEDIHEFVRAVVTAAHDEEGAARLRDIVSTSERLRQHLPATGASTLGEIIGRDIVDKVCEWLHVGSGLDSQRANTTPHNTDLGNAERLIARHGQNLRFHIESGKWVYWDGSHWVIDSTGHVERLAKETVKSLYLESAVNGHASPDHIKHAIKSEAEARIRATVNLAKTESAIPVTSQQLDGNIRILNCSNGALDLQTGRLSPHEREHLCTKILSVPYDPQAQCPMWLTFLDRIFDRNQSLIDFVQRAVGYSLSGCVSEQVLFILHGDGANGKSTFVESIRALLGPYAMQADFETFLTKRNEGISNDLARLQGARFLSAVEAADGRTLQEAIVKQATGGDTITARFLYKEHFEYIPQFKLWLVANCKPRVTGTDDAIWRRIRLIPFVVTIPPPERDKQLLEKLKSELSGILVWALHGCLEWFRSGLGESMDVEKATEDYRREMDVISPFIEQCCALVPTGSAQAGELYRQYRCWCDRNSEQPVSQTKFALSLRKLGCEPRRTGSRRLWSGIQLTGDVQ
jgi:putative DNA primase/helicase